MIFTQLFAMVYSFANSWMDNTPSTDYNHLTNTSAISTPPIYPLQQHIPTFSHINKHISPEYIFPQNNRFLNMFHQIYSIKQQIGRQIVLPADCISYTSKSVVATSPVPYISLKAPASSPPESALTDGRSYRLRWISLCLHQRRWLSGR